MGEHEQIRGAFLVVITPFITIEHPACSKCQKLSGLPYSLKANTPVDLHKRSNSVVSMDWDNTAPIHLLSHKFTVAFSSGFSRLKLACQA